MLLRAFARARALRPLRLIILGEGSLRPELEQLVRTLNIASDVMLPGFMDNPFVWMRHAKIFVVSSRFEGLSMVLIEAMASGTSVISTDCAGGPREILEEGKWGRLVPVGDSDTMARVIIETLNHPLPVDVRERAAYFSVERATDQYLKIMGCEVSPP
jgi:glycosyltransferase involved in cell wall biosynthesis